VQDKYWTRTVQVERLGPVEETGTALPEGARLIQSWREVVRHEDVLDHYETRTRQVSERVQVGTREYVCGQRDMGNGYFEDITCTEPEYDTEYRTETYQEPVYRREPVYGTMYRYRVDRWSPDTLLKEGGARDEPPAWPAVRLREKQREGARTEEYVVLARDTAGTLHTVHMPLEEYRAQRIGQAVLLRVTRGGEATLVPATPEAADTTVSAAGAPPPAVSPPRRAAGRLRPAGREREAGGLTRRRLPRGTSRVTLRAAFPPSGCGFSASDADERMDGAESGPRDRAARISLTMRRRDSRSAAMRLRRDEHPKGGCSQRFRREVRDAEDQAGAGEPGGGELRDRRDRGRPRHRAGQRAGHPRRRPQLRLGVRRLSHGPLHLRLRSDLQPRRLPDLLPAVLLILADRQDSAIRAG
jgi:hypothetical protein